MTREPTIADELGGHWHKLVAALLARHGDQTLAVDDFARLEGKTVVVGHRQGGTVMELRLMDDAEAERLQEEYQRAARRRC